MSKAQDEVILLERMILSANQLTQLGDQVIVLLESKRAETPPELLPQLDMLIIGIAALKFATDVNLWAECVKLLAMFLSDLDSAVIPELDARSKMTYEDRIADLDRRGKGEHDPIGCSTSGNDRSGEGPTGSGGGSTLN